MNDKKTVFIFYAALVTLLLFFSSPSVSSCNVIEKLPYTVSRGGCYTLAADMTLDSINTHAITIAGDRVTIDLNNKTISGSFQKNARNAGVFANNVKNLKIKNGAIKGFMYGIRVSGEKSKNTFVSGITSEENTFRGISVNGASTRIFQNTILNIGGTTVYPDAFSIGIRSRGDDCRISYNIIKKIHPTGVGEGLGISLGDKRNNCILSRNFIKNDIEDNGTFAVWVTYSKESNTTLSKNIFAGYVLPFSMPPHLEIKDNVIQNIRCNQKNYGPFYSTASNDNLFINSDETECPLLISTLKKRYNPDRPDARDAFRLAVAMYHCEAVPLPTKQECCSMMHASFSYYQKAIDLGLDEAARVLPAVKNAVAIDPRCQQK